MQASIHRTSFLILSHGRNSLRPGKRVNSRARISNFMQRKLLRSSLVFSFLFFFISVAFVSAQEKATVKGRVLDASGAPVEAASIGIGTEAGADMGAFTDKEGRFSIEINAGVPVVLIISHIGF